MIGSAGLILQGVSAGYGETVVIESIALDLPPGETLAVLGRNGVGKTTLLATIMGHTRLRSGSIRFTDREISSLPAYRRARLGIGFVPQEREIFPSLTVEENLVVAERPGQWSLLKVYDFFPALAERRRNRGNQLSGGEQQMLAIGRALMGNPRLLLMDEPLASLDELTRDDLREELLRLWEGRARSVVYVTHDIEEAVLLADRVAVIGGRPARILGEVDIPLARPRTKVMRRGPAFYDLVEDVRTLLA